MRAINGPNDINAAVWESYGADWLFARDAIPFAQARAMHERSLAVFASQGPSLPAEFAGRVRFMLSSDLRRWGDITTALRLFRQDAHVEDKDPLSRWWHGFTEIRIVMLSDQAAEASAIGRTMLGLKREWKRARDLRTTYDLLALALLHARRYAEAAEARAEYEALPGVAAERAAERDAHATPDDSDLLVALAGGRVQHVVDITEGLVPKAAIHADEVAWLSRARALCTLRRHDEALTLFDAWLPRLADDRYDASPVVAFWNAQAGLCALDAHDRRRAAAWSAPASAAIARQPAVSPHYKAAVLELQGRLAAR